MEAGKHGTTSNTPTPDWALKTNAEIVADIESVLKTTTPVQYNEEGFNIFDAALKDAFKTEKTFQFNFNVPGQGEVKPFTAADLEAFNQSLQDHTHTEQDSDMIKTKAAPAMAMEDLTAAKASEDQEPGLEFGVSTEEANSEVLQMVDEYTALQSQIDAADVSHLIKKQDELKKQLQSIAKSDQFPAHKPVQLWGTHENYVQFSEQKSMQKITDKPGLIDAIGMAKYMANTEITLANAKKLLSENELGKFTTNTPGPRTLNAVVLGTPPGQQEDN
jgi:acyl-CoA-binding protein